MYCPACGTEMPAGPELPVGPEACPQCGWREVVRTSIDADPTMRILLPVGRSGMAIVAGYLGLLSPLCIFAPFALLTGVLALRELRDKPNLGGRGRAIFGIVMGTIFTLVLVIAILVGAFQ